MTDLFSIPLVAAGDGWLPYAVGVVAKGTLLLALVFATAAALRRTSASARHLVWSIGLAAVLALPFLSATLPWQLEILPAATAATPADRSDADPMATGPESAERARDVMRADATAPAIDPAAGAERAAGEVTDDAATGASAETATRDGAQSGLTEVGAASVADASTVSPNPTSVVKPLAPAVTPSAAPDEGAHAAGAAGSPSVGSADRADVGGLGTPATIILSLLALWAAGTLLLLGRVGVGSVAVRRIAHRAEPLASSDWTTPYYEAADRLDLDRLPRLLMSGDVTLPFTYGLFRPTIVLPAAASEWTDDRRRAVLLHEIGHIRRLDLWSHLIGRLACALYWFHPLVWMAAKRARAESERACDDLVLRTGTRASTYADHLLQIVRGANRASAPAVAIPMAQRNEFEGRMLAILEPDVRRDSPGRAQSAGLIAAVVLLTFGVAAMAPASTDGSPVDGSRLAANGEAGEAARTDEATGARARDAREQGTDDERTADAGRARAGEAVGFAGAADPDTERGSDVPPAGGADGAADDAATSPDGAVAAADTPTTPAPKPLRVPGSPDWAFGYWWPGVDVSGITGEALTAAYDALDPEMIVNAVDLAFDAVDHAAVATAVEAARHAASGAIAAPMPSPTPTPVPMATPTPMPTPTPAPTPAGGHDYDFDYDDDRDRGRRNRRGAADTAAVRALIRALNDTEAEVRRIAAHTLGEIGDPLAVPGLSRALREEEDAEVRRMIAWALAEIEDPAAVPALSRALREDDDVTVRRRAAWALGEIEDARSLEALGTATGDADPQVARMAVWAIGEIGRPEGAPQLEAALAHSSAEVRRMAAWAHGELDAETAPPALVRALGDESDDVRRMAAWALGEIEDPGTADALLGALGDDSHEVRRTALWALGEIGGPAARDALIQAIESDDPEIRKLAARALARTY